MTPELEDEIREYAIRQIPSPKIMERVYVLCCAVWTGDQWTVVRSTPQLSPNLSGLTATERVQIFDALSDSELNGESHAKPTRWNIERDGDDLLVCFGDHDKNESCDYVRYIRSDRELNKQQGES